MTPHQHSQCNDVLGPPPKTAIEACSALPILRAMLDGETPCIVSFWKPDAEELKLLNAGHCVALCIQGRTHAPVKVGVALK